MKIKVNHKNLENKSDKLIIKEMIRKNWKIDSFFSNEENIKNILLFFYKYLEKTADTKTHIYKENKLVSIVYSICSKIEPKSFKLENFDNLEKKFINVGHLKDLNNFKHFKHFFATKFLFEWNHSHNLMESGVFLAKFVDLSTNEDNDVLDTFHEQIKDLYKNKKWKTAYYFDFEAQDQNFSSYFRAIPRLKIKIESEFFCWYETYVSLTDKIGFNDNFFKLQPHHIYYEKHMSHDKSNRDKNFLLIHGLASSSVTFNKMIDFLRGYGNVYLIDLPLHAKSNIEPLNEIYWDAINMGIYVSTLIKKLNLDNLIIWGHSFGAAITMVLSYFIKERIKSIILEDAYNPQALTNRRDFFKSLSYAAIKGFEFNKKYNLTQVQKDMTKQFNEQNENSNVYKPITSRTIFFLNNLLFEPVRYFLDWIYTENTDVDTLVLYGVYDHVISTEESKKYFESLTNNYIFKTIKYASHSAHLNNPLDVYKEISSFLINKNGWTQKR